MRTDFLKETDHMFSHPDLDLAVDNRRRNELADEIRRLRIGREFGRPRPVLSLPGMFDAAIVRLSEGAARRHAIRQSQGPAAS